MTGFAGRQTALDAVQDVTTLKYAQTVGQKNMFVICANVADAVKFACVKIVRINFAMIVMSKWKRPGRKQIKMTHTGFIKIYRSLADHPLWTVKPFSKGQAWVDILINANHSDGYFYLRGQKVEVKRGQLGWSIVHLGIRWGWSRTKVKNFLNLLEKEQQIVQSQSNITSVLTIVNYEKYQQRKQQTGQQEDIKKTSRRHQKDTNKKNKKNKNEKNDKLYCVGATQTHTIKSFKKWNENEFFAKAQEANNGRLSQKELQAFCEYWTERGDGVKLMLFQRRQTFDVSRRIATWARNDFSTGKQSGDEEVCKEKQRRKNELAGQLLKEIYDS